MAGAIDVPNQFPNSMMANAVKAGQSRFGSVQTAAVGATVTETAPAAAPETPAVPPAAAPPP